MPYGTTNISKIQQTASGFLKYFTCVPRGTGVKLWRTSWQNCLANRYTPHSRSKLCFSLKFQCFAVRTVLPYSPKPKWGGPHQAGPPDGAGWPFARSAARALGGEPPAVAPLPRGSSLLRHSLGGTPSGGPLGRNSLAIDDDAYQWSSTHSNPFA